MERIIEMKMILIQIGYSFLGIFLFILLLKICNFGPCTVCKDTGDFIGLSKFTVSGLNIQYGGLPRILLEF